MGKRIIQMLDSLLNAIVIAICGVFLLVSGYSLLDNHWLYQNSRDKSLLAYKPAQNTQDTQDAQSAPPAPETEIQFISGKQVGWLQVYDTNIDYPLMQGEDNFEFLNLDPYGEFYIGGSIFMDYRNDINLLDEYTVIYGHHMGFGNMFGSLDSFIDQNYFNEHRQGRIVTRNGSYDLKLFAVTEGEGSDQILFNPLGRTKHEITAYLKEHARIYIDEDMSESRVVALTTCWGETSSSRLLVYGLLKNP